jgi:TRAP-type transport system periplasmic protein
MSKRSTWSKCEIRNHQFRGQEIGMGDGLGNQVQLTLGVFTNIKRRCKMKRGFLALLAVCFLTGMCIGMGSPAWAAPEKPIELKVMIFTPPDSPMNKDVFIPWGKKVEELTGGRVKVVTYPGELLGKLKETYERTLSGVADIGWAFCNQMPGQFPLLMGFELPFMFSHPVRATRVVWETFQKEPSLQAEFREVKVLWVHSGAAGQLHTTQKAVRTMEDLKGLKIRVPGGSQAAAIKALGGTVVGMPTPDIYLALERKTIDGVIIPWEAVKAYRFHEFTKYHTEISLSFGTGMAIMNKKKWESLSPDVQKIIDSLSGASGAELSAKAWEKTDTEALQMVKGMTGQEIINPPANEMARWKKTVEPIWDEWVKEMEGKKLPAKKILDETVRLTEKYAK